MMPSGDDCIIVRPLLWRSPAMSDFFFFKAIDDQAKGQAKHFVKKRVVVSASERPWSKDPKIPKNGHLVL